MQDKRKFPQSAFSTPSGQQEGTKHDKGVTTACNENEKVLANAGIKHNVSRWSKKFWSRIWAREPLGRRTKTKKTSSIRNLSTHQKTVFFLPKDPNYSHQTKGVGFGCLPFFTTPTPLQQVIISITFHKKVGLIPTPTLFPALIPVFPY